MYLISLLDNNITSFLQIDDIILRLYDFDIILQTLL